MTMVDFLVWVFIAASLAFSGDGLIARGKTRNARDLGRWLYDFSGAMLLVAVVVLWSMAGGAR